jgi:hypothetical protein
MTGEHNQIVIERPTRLQRSGSLSSLNDDVYNNDVSKRKMTVLEVPPLATTVSSSHVPPNEDNNPLKKLSDDLRRISLNFVNDHLHQLKLPDTIFICLPREIRRHHVNSSWLADEKNLYQIKSPSDYIQLYQGKNSLDNLADGCDDTMKNRYRRYTDGNKHRIETTHEARMASPCQNDCHMSPLS